MMLLFPGVCVVDKIATAMGLAGCMTYGLARTFILGTLLSTLLS